MKNIILSIIILSFITDLFLDNLYKKTREGNLLYKQQKYEEALKKYTDAQLDAPESPELHYNIALIFYKQKEYEKAVEEFQKALKTERVELQEKTYFNLGNCYVMLNKPLEAIENYKKALELDPNDEDAKYNLELVRRLLKSGPSENALKLKKEIEKLVKERKYRLAWEKTQEALQSEPTFAKLGDFINRVKDLADIFEPAPTPTPLPLKPTPNRQPTPVFSLTKTPIKSI